MEKNKSLEGGIAAIVLTILAVTALVALSLLSSTSMAGSNASVPGPWPMSHQNAQHTGLSPFPGPAAPFLQWKFHTGGIIDSPPAISHERVYLTSEDGNVYALNLHGSLLWTFRTGWPLKSTPAVGADGTIYVAGCVQCEQSPNNDNPQGVLYALNPGGQLKWNLTLPNAGEGTDILASPTIGPDGTIYTSNLDFRILAINPNGVIKWSVSTGGEVFVSPTMGHDGTLYVGIDDDNPSLSSLCGQCLVALHPDGTLKWSLGPHFSPFSIAVSDDGTIYAGNRAISPDGLVKWAFPSGGIGGIGPNGTIYALNAGVSAINPDGSLLWHFPIEAPSGSGGPCCFYGFVEQSSVAIGSNGIVYFGAGVEGFCNCAPIPSGYGNASLYAVAPNGTLAWKFVIHPTAACETFDCPIVQLSDPAIGSDGTIYVGSADGNLYAIG